MKQKFKTGKIKMKNGSIIYFKSSKGKYKHIKGKSLNRVKIDIASQITANDMQRCMKTAGILLTTARVYVKNSLYGKAVSSINKAIQQLNFIIDIDKHSKAWRQC